MLLSLLASAYFVFHTIHGRHGLETRQALIEKGNILDFEIKTLETVRDQLRRDVALLSPEVPNADLVEEIARDVLGYARPSDELLIEPVAAR